MPHVLEEKLKKLKLVLDETMEFPTEYHFKFIVPASEVHHILLIVEEIENIQLEQKASANGNYISVTVKTLVRESDEIILVYQKISVVKGVISL